MGRRTAKTNMLILTNNNFARAPRSTLLVQHGILHISLPSLHHYDMKLPNFTSRLYGAGQKTTQKSGPYLGFFVCGGKLGFREISDQYSYKKQPSKIRHYVRKKTFSFPGGGNCPLRPPAMYGPGNCRFLFLILDNDRYGPKENFAEICQIK